MDPRQAAMLAQADKITQNLGGAKQAAHYSQEWLHEMEALLKKHGFDPKDAKALADEGMGPHELEHRLKTTKPGEMGSLEYTHGLKRRTAEAPPGWEETVKDMKKHPEIDNPWALAWYQKGEGHKPHTAGLVERADALVEKLAASPVLWKYVDEDGQEFFLPSRRQNVHSPYTGKSTPQRPEKYQLGEVGKELREVSKGVSGAPGPKAGTPKKKKHAADDPAWK